MKKCLQFELWHNCSNGCSFCYLNTNRIHYSEEQKCQAINRAIDIIQSDRSVGYEALGLIGGELFGDQLSDQHTLDCFIDLIRVMKSKLDKEEISEIWLTSNLITNDLSSLKKVLNVLNENIREDQRILICTSYDTKGRFKNNDYDLWLSNLNELNRLFPKIILHIECITTQCFIDEWLNDTSKFTAWLDRGFLIDFKPPNITAWNYTKEIRDLDTYRLFLDDFAKTQFDGYLMKSRSNFLQFCESVLQTKNGKIRLRDFAANDVESELLYSIPWDIWYETRWISKEENAPCGHRWDGHTYLDRPEKCCKCDIERILELEDKKACTKN